jgi:hypothetical protein
LLPPFADLVKAEYVVLRNTLEAPVSFSSESRAWQPEAKLVDLAWYLSWEQERRTRIMNAYFAGYLRAAERPYSHIPSAAPQLLQPGWDARARLLLDGWLPATKELDEDLSANQLARLIEQSWLRPLLPQWSGDHPRRAYVEGLAHLRAARLQLALALYQIEEGKPAATLDDLVPRYLAELPVDPFTGRGFQYRVSQGERWPDEGRGAAVGTPGMMGDVMMGGDVGGAGVMVPGAPGGEVGRAGGPGMPSPGKLIPAGQGIVQSAGLSVLVPQWPKPEPR